MRRQATIEGGARVRCCQYTVTVDQALFTERGITWSMNRPAA